MHHRKVRSLKLEAADIPSLLGRVTQLLGSKGCDIQKLSVEEAPVDADEAARILITLSVRLSKGAKVSEMIEELLRLEGVRSVSLD